VLVLLCCGIVGCSPGGCRTVEKIEESPAVRKEEGKAAKVLGRWLPEKFKPAPGGGGELPKEEPTFPKTSYHPHPPDHSDNSVYCPACKGTGQCTNYTMYGPIPVTCPICFGSKKVNKEDIEKCFLCNGKGYVFITGIYGETLTSTCSHCQGLGIVRR